MSPSEPVRDRRRLGPAASIGWLALAAFFGIVIVTGTSGEASATDWIWIGGYLMIIATSLLGDLRRPARRALVGITAIVAVATAGRFDALPAQIGATTDDRGPGRHRRRCAAEVTLNTQPLTGVSYCPDAPCARADDVE